MLVSYDSMMNPKYLKYLGVGKVGGWGGGLFLALFRFCFKLTKMFSMLIFFIKIFLLVLIFWTLCFDLTKHTGFYIEFHFDT